MLIYIQTELSGESSAERGITSLWVTTPLLGRWQREAGSREKESHYTDVLKEQLAFSVSWWAEHCSCLLAQCKYRNSLHEGYVRSWGNS